MSLLWLSAGLTLRARAQEDLPKVLVVRDRMTGVDYREAMVEALDGLAETVPEQGYLKDARDQGLPWYSDEGFEQALPRQKVDMAVVVAASGNSRKRRLHVTFRAGGTGEVWAERDYTYSGARMSPVVKARVRKEAKLALDTFVKPKGKATAAKTPAPVKPPPTKAEPVKPPPTKTEPVEPAEEAPGASEEKPNPATEPAEDAEARVSSGERESKTEDESDADDKSDESEADSGSRFRLQMTAGAGLATRLLKIPSPLGFQRLATSAFPAVEFVVRAHIVPKANAKTTYALQLRYISSLFLRVNDTRGDGSMRNTSSRVQRFEFSGSAVFSVSGGKAPLAVEPVLGWGIDAFSSELAITFPDFNFSGPFFRLGAHFPLWDGLLTLTLAPEASLVLVGDALKVLGASQVAVALGGQAVASVRISDSVFLSLSYRESQVLLSTKQGGSANDVSRFVITQITYVP